MRASRTASSAFAATATAGTALRTRAIWAATATRRSVVAGFGPKAFSRSVEIDYFKPTAIGWPPLRPDRDTGSGLQKPDLSTRPGHCADALPTRPDGLPPPSRPRAR